MNKPEQPCFDTSNYIPYDRLFSPQRPFSRYIFYAPEFYISLEALIDPVLLYNVGCTAKEYMGKNSLRRHSLNQFKENEQTLMVNFDLDKKFISFMRNGVEIFRATFDHYILLNEDLKWG